MIILLSKMIEYNEDKGGLNNEQQYKITNF